MDKLKKVFSPGSSKDEEVMYGEGSTSNTAANTTTPEADKLQSHPDADRQGSVTRQILNPGGDKYDEQRFGTTAQSTGTDPRRESIRPEAPPTVGTGQQLQTDPEHKDKSVLRQILNPGGDKYDEQSFGSTSTATGQPLGDREDVPRGSGLQSSTGVGSTSQNTSHLGRDAAAGTGVGATGAGAYGAHDHGHGQSLGEREDVHRSAPVGSNNQTSLPDRSQQQSQYAAGPGATSDSSHLGRDAGIAGGLAGAGGAGAYGAQRSEQQTQVPIAPGASTTASNNPTDRINNRDVGIVGSSVIGTTASDSTPRENTTSSSVLDRSHPLAGSGGVNPIGSPGTDNDQSHLGRDATFAGGVGAAGAGAHGAHNSHNAPRDGTTTGSVLDRAHPLHGTGSDAHDTAAQDIHQAQLSSGGRINPVGAPDEGLRTGHQGHDPQSHFGGAGSSLGHGTAADSSASTQLNRAPHDVQDATYTAISYPVGPHPTMTGNRLDPHIPGQYPEETGGRRDEVPGTSGYTEGLNTSDRSRDGTSGASGVAGGAGASALNSRDNDHHATGMPSTTTGSHAGNTSSVGGVGAQSTGNNHHYGRDAGVAGGLGAAGAGAYAAHESSHNRDGRSLGEREDVPRQGGSSSTTGGTGGISHQTSSTAGTTGMSHPTGSTTSSAYPTESRDHHARDGALAGGVAGAGAGAGLHAAHGEHDRSLGDRADVRRADPSSTTSSHPTTTTTHHPTTTTTTTTSSQPTTADRRTEHHGGRDAALAGGAGAAGVGAYEASRHHGDNTLGERNDMHSHDPSTTSGSAITGYGPGESNPSGIINAPGTTSRTTADDVHHHGHHHGRDTTSADPAHTTTHRATETPSHTGRDAALGAGAGGAAAYGAERAHDDDKHGHNKLHKPSPEEKRHEKEERKHEKELEHEKKPGLLDRILHPGGHKSHEEDRGHHHGTGAASTTGATGAATHSGSTAPGTGHAFGTTHAGDRGHPLGTAAEPRGDERTIEPHTGLPMNTAKYGSGAGGTDGAQNIPGYHETDPALRQATMGTGQGVGTSSGHHQPGEQGVAGPDWDAIKKSNTPY